MNSLLTTASRFAFGLAHGLDSPKLSILIFHRVHARADTLFPYEPDAINFERLMRFVAASFRVMSLAEAAAGLARGELPARALVVTFDDGYADNAEVALPILQRCGIVASFFVSTGFLDGGRMWNDSVIETVRACRHEQLDLDGFGLGLCPLAGPAARRNVIASLLAHIKYLSLNEREEAIARLQEIGRAHV